MYSNSAVPYKLSIKPCYCTVFQEPGYGDHYSLAPKPPRAAADRSANGIISPRARKRLMAAVEWLMLISKQKTVFNHKLNRYFTFNLSLVTLTLPAQQFHSDLYIKKYMLNEFLTMLRKSHYVENYIWKAEKTLKGNIHFHIVIDKYIHYKDINRLWCNVLNTHGYIDKYRAAMQAHHAKGFRAFKTLLPHWPLDRQKQAYLKGKANNWRFPVGVTDIHSLRKVRNAKAYIAKYLSKNPSLERKIEGTVRDMCHDMQISCMSDLEIEAVKDFYYDKLKVSGNIWYISRGLSLFKSAVIDVNDQVRSELDNFIKMHPAKVRYFDYSTVFFAPVSEMQQLSFSLIYQCFQKYVQSIKQSYEPPGSLFVKT